MKKIDQSTNTKDLEEEFDLADCKSVNIPMKAGAKTEMGDPEDDEEADIRLYQRLRGGPMYLL